MSRRCKGQCFLLHSRTKWWIKLLHIYGTFMVSIHIYGTFAQSMPCSHCLIILSHSNEFQTGMPGQFKFKPISTFLKVMRCFLNPQWFCYPGWWNPGWGSTSSKFPCQICTAPLYTPNGTILTVTFIRAHLLRTCRYIVNDAAELRRLSSYDKESCQPRWGCSSS